MSGWFVALSGLCGILWVAVCRLWCMHCIASEQDFTLEYNCLWNPHVYVHNHKPYAMGVETWLPITTSARSTDSIIYKCGWNVSTRPQWKARNFPLYFCALKEYRTKLFNWKNVVWHFFCSVLYSRGNIVLVGIFDFDFAKCYYIDHNFIINIKCTEI